MMKSLSAIGLLTLSFAGPPTCHAQDGSFFARRATFHICEQTGGSCATSNATVAEIVTATTDGMTLLYTNSAMQSIGFVDVQDPLAPLGLGEVAMEGEPTSVAVVNARYAVAGVNTSPDFVNVSGQAVVIDVASRTIVRTLEIGGQPDAVAVSPDGDYVAIAIENERDEDLNDGLIPQMPAGFLVVMDTAAEDPMEWTFDTVSLTNLTNVLYPTDPEPEYVAINRDNICAVTLQENNAVVLVDLTTLEVKASFDMGFPSINQVDVLENGVIQQDSNVLVPREPDAVTWIDSQHFATANEGDLDGGSRGITIFDTTGTVVYDSGHELEWEAAKVGHYPESRSDAKGNEPEGILYAEFGTTPYLFVLSERSSIVFVYTVEDVSSPQLVQILPTQQAPEGVVAIPDRNLLVVASETDERENGLRSALTIYVLGPQGNEYPTLVSDHMEGNPDMPYIPFAALSGLAADDSPTAPGQPGVLYAVEDSFFKSNRMFVIDTTASPAVITSAVALSDSNDLLADAIASLNDTPVQVNATAVSMINEDGTVNLDLEGIARSSDGGFWMVSEGSGTFDDPERPYEYPNFLFKVNDAGAITEAILLPMALTMVQLRFGLEGVAEDGEKVVVAFQRAWNDEAHPRLGIFDTVSQTWSFVFYPLDDVESSNGGWVGLSDISALGNGQFLVLERDDQAGPDASIKRLYRIDLGDFSTAVEMDNDVDVVIERQQDTIPVVEKTLVLDIIPVVEEKTNAKSPEKWEGLAVTAGGEVFVVNDNDGVDNNSGEQQLLNLGNILMEAEDDDIIGEGSDVDEENNSGASSRLASSFVSAMILAILS